jgi:hypothetical protein
MFKIGDLVVSRGLYSRKYGTGKIIEIERNVATVIFEHNLATESFHVAMLKKSKSAK